MTPPAGPHRPLVAIVVSHPIQHFCPFYRAIAADGRVRIHVLFGSTAGARTYFDRDFNREIRWSSPLLDGYSHEFLPGSESASPDRSISNPWLACRLDALQPDVVLIYGFFHGLSRAALAWGRIHHRPVLEVADSELRRPRSIGTRIRKMLTVPLLLSQVDAFLTVGDCNEAYYRHYGARPERFFRCPFPIDEAAIAAACDNRVQLRAQVRDELGIPADAFVGLVVGKLTTRKRPEDAIRAFARAAARTGGSPALRLILAGDGPERDALARIAEREAPGLVSLPGFVDVQRLPAFYVASDLLIHPSSADPHPLAISEAIACGLPVIVFGPGRQRGPDGRRAPGRERLRIPVRGCGGSGPARGAACDGRSPEEPVRRSFAPDRRRSDHARERRRVRARHERRPRTAALTERES